MGIGKNFCYKSLHPMIAVLVLLHTACNLPMRTARSEPRKAESTAMSNPEPKSPLTIIAIFAGIIEASALASLPFLGESSQSIYTWFLVGFPPFLTLLFFLTLNFNTKSLYGPEEQLALTEEAGRTTRDSILPTAELQLSHTDSCVPDSDNSTVIISGPDSQALLDALARHAVRAPGAGGLVLHNLEAGTRTTIVTESPSDHSPSLDKTKKTRH